jgi:predicted RNA binding protein YcfA (HicA-like mRNA interferase family)
MSLPSSAEIIKALIKDGFYARGKSKPGSHQAFRKESKEGNKTVIVPMGKREIPSGTLSSILRQAGLTRNELDNLMK